MFEISDDEDEQEVLRRVSIPYQFANLSFIVTN